MNKVLDEIKVLMHENGYSIEEIKKVVDAFNNFISYVSRNRLDKELETYIPSIRNKVLRRITSKKSASNIAGVAEFNGNSPASTFVKGCVERRVQDVLKGFLRSSEIYYNMACNSEGVDATHLLAQLSLDEIDRDKSVELTAPTTIMAFSTELSLKTLYSVKNYNTIIKNIYADVTKLENGGYPNEGILNNRVRMIERVSGDWKNIGISKNAQQTMNDVRDSYTDDKPVNLSEDDGKGNVKVNGHTLYKVFEKLPEEYRTMIKYQITTAFSRGDKKSLDDKVVSAIDYFLMISTLDTTLENMDPTKQMVLNSNNFDRMRYLIDQLGSEELLFSMAYATSSYIVAKNEVEGRCFSSIKNCDYTSDGLQFTGELNELISSNPDKKYLLDYIVNNKQLLGVAKTLSPKDLYVLIDMFNLDEINWMKDSCNVEDSCSFKEMMYYCVFFKRHLNDYEFRYTGQKYKNINRLFYTIKSTNNLAMLGTQIAQWFAEINIYSLSQEEFDALKIFDNEFIFNSLSYKDRILYKKCSDRGIPFKIYYMSNVYTASINKYIDGQDFDAKNFEEKIDSAVNNRFNTFFLVKDKRFNKIKRNVELYELLCEEFDGEENIPSYIVNLPLGDLRVILLYCYEHELSLKNLSRDIMTSPCFFCRTTNMIQKINQMYTRYNVKLGFGIESISDKKNKFSVQRCVYSPNVKEFLPMNESKYFDMFDMIYKENNRSLVVEFGNPTDKEILDYLLSIGVDFMSATYLQKKFDRQTLLSFVKYILENEVPIELLGMIVDGRIPKAEILEKKDFFIRNGCRLEDIPIKYYTRHDLDVSVFARLFRILDGVYKKENIPGCLLVENTSFVEQLINRLKQENINIYHFMSFMPSDSVHLYTNIDLYIYAYKNIKELPINSGMILKDFDLVVADYSQMRYLLGLEEDNATLLRVSLYQELDGMMAIKSLCEARRVEFVPELLYFDVGFLEAYLEEVYTLVDGIKQMGMEITFANALTYMEKKGWKQKDYKVDRMFIDAEPSVSGAIKK